MLFIHSKELKAIKNVYSLTDGTLCLILLIVISILSVNFPQLNARLCVAKRNKNGGW